MSGSTLKEIKVIAFDADDTLWVNETFYREAEKEFYALLATFETPVTLEKKLFDIEIGNLPIYGYGIKAFMLSMMETAIKVTNGNISPAVTRQIIAIGKNMLNKPVELLSGVNQVLSALHGKYRLVIATKGDLLDQERKLQKSGLQDFFEHVEIMSDKKEDNYKKLLKVLQVEPEHFLMIGNSAKSDILPVLNLGGFGIHVPFYTTWAHEELDEHLLNRDRSFQCPGLLNILPLLEIE